MRRPNVTNAEELRWVDHSPGEKFTYRRKGLSSAAAGELLRGR